MDNAGDYSLFTGAITAPLTRSTGVQTLIPNLQGMTALTLDFDFKYGSGGSTCSAIVQTVPSTDSSKARDVARADFTTAPKITQFNIEALLSLGATAYADLASEGVNDGRLFSQLQVVLIVTGNYVGTTLSVTAGVR